MEIIERPPLGLEPQYIHKRKRIYAIIEAVARYRLASQPIPGDWLEELRDLLNQDKPDKPNPTLP